MKPDRALELLLSKGFSLTYSTVMCAVFAAVGFYTEIGRDAQLVWIFGSGVHAGMALMWLFSPSITEKWKREIREELHKAGEEALREMRESIEREFPSPTIIPYDHERRMH